MTKKTRSGSGARKSETSKPHELVHELQAKQRKRRRKKGRLRSRLDKLRAAIKRAGDRIKRVRERLRHRHHGGKLRQPGADVSMYQGSIDWGAYGPTWAFVKATEGLTWVDPTFSGARVAAMRKAGVVVGFYHFAHVTEDPRAQARHFAATIKAAGARHGDLAALDYEQAGGNAEAFLAGFAAEFRKETKGISLGTYGGPYLHEVRDNRNTWLWLAAYVSNPSSYVPPAWSTWTFWQFTDHYSFAGIGSPCDASRFNGDRDAFDRIRHGG